MKTVKGLSLLFGLMLAAGAFGGEGLTLSPSREAAYRVEGGPSVREGVVVQQMTRTSPGRQYAVRGKVRYENVEGTAYLEMYTILPDGGRYFSRTLADSGPLGKITGSSAWRPFELPFNLMDQTPESVTLEIGVVMPGGGVIELSSLEYVEAGSSKTGVWFSMFQAAEWGNILALGIGIAGACLGILCFWLIPRGQAQSLMYGLSYVLMTLAVIMALLGLAALLSGQPAYVWAWFLIFGVIGLLVFGGIYLFAIRPGYRRAEQRRMQALDL